MSTAEGSPAGDTADVTDPVVRELLLVEYKTLRDEVLKKMDHRTSLLVSSLTVSLLALGVGIERNSAPLLLVVPVICVLFGLLVQFNNKSIYDACDYIATNIEAPLDRAYPGSFRWQLTRKPRTRRMRELMWLQHVPSVLVVFIPSLVAIVIALGSGVSVSIVLAAVLDIAALGFYFRQYLTVALGR